MRMYMYFSTHTHTLHTHSDVVPAVNPSCILGPWHQVSEGVSECVWGGGGGVSRGGWRGKAPGVRDGGSWQPLLSLHPSLQRVAGDGCTSIRPGASCGHTHTHTHTQTCTYRNTHTETHIHTQKHTTCTCMFSC